MVEKLGAWVKVKRSEKEFPYGSNIAFSYLKKIWEQGWLDEYSDKHFLIRVLKNDNQFLKSLFDGSKYTYDGVYSVNCETFLINFNFRLLEMSLHFGEEKIENFIKNQLSAGKKHYNQNQFFQALSEIEVIRYFLAFGNSFEKNCVYEPTVNNSKCNPEASIRYSDGTIINIEVKTPEFTNKLNRFDRYMPLLLLNEEGRREFEKMCKYYGAYAVMPRVMKLKEFLNSAATKFEEVEDNVKVYNILFINWTYTEIRDNGYYEACSLLYNDVNGILKYPEVGKKLGVHEDVYKKISAIFVYQCPDEMMMFHDFRYLFASRSAAFLINPFVVNSENKIKEIHKLMRFQKNDFKWMKELYINFDVDEAHFDEKVLEKLGQIVVKNVLD